jgi:hypothetical protein
MLLKRELLEQIKAGEVDLVFRRWSRPTVKAGGTLKTKLGVLAIGAVTEMSADDVSEADARRAGFADVAAFQRWLATMKDGAIFQRIEVRFPDEAA